uniref:Uncharacterized protein n=1 Tax=Arundo donax TaxID=35708 RepID=A0A0A9BX96_ARUDO
MMLSESGYILLIMQSIWKITMVLYT